MSMDPDGLHDLADQLQSILELASGYRAKAVAAGFSDKAAEMMALELHRAMVQTAFGNNSR